MTQNKNDPTEKQPWKFRAERYGPETSKAELLLLLDFTTHQAQELLHALYDIVDSYMRDDGPDMTVAIAYADSVVAQARDGKKIT